ncbi:MAG: phage tail sheath C-terminal domain-containing protein [Azospirillaceae bacterium]|nr:phage tail sheath C-terminal domain-containing protein [Azospirillaceae bacterium]
MAEALAALPDVAFPGVPIAERGPEPVAVQGLPSGVPAFLGPLAQGPVGRPVRVTSLAVFLSQFGALTSDTALAVAQFFAQGGTAAWVVNQLASVDGPSAVDQLMAGLSTLDAAENYDLVHLPELRALAPSVGAEALGLVADHCDRRGLFLIADLPRDVADIPAALQWARGLTGPRYANVALYFPDLMVPDPTRPEGRRRVGPGAAVAGLYATNDRNAGLWHTPAGTDFPFPHSLDLSARLGTSDMAALTGAGINALAVFPRYGAVPWGGRTLAGAGSEWRQIALRRLALHVETSLARGWAWAAVEANGADLWKRLTTTGTAFLEGLRQQGAFTGTRPDQGYFLRCDLSTTTQEDRDRGLCRAVVGIAPIRPAEFLLMTITLRTADAALA